MIGSRRKQMRTIIILLIAVVVLTVGFAAFSSNLIVKTRVSVNPNSGTFNVKFSNAGDRLDESKVVPTKSSEIFTAYDGVINNKGIPTIENLGGEMTQPGEVITYDFYTLNTGEHNAYLTDIIFNNVDKTSTTKKCTSVNGTNQTAVDEACKSISIKVIMGDDKITGTTSLVGHELLPNTSEPVKVVIEYASTGVLPEVDFEVEFGSISMIYSSLEGNEEVAPINPENTYTSELPDECYFSFSEGVINYYNPNASNCSSYGNPGNIPSSLPVTPIRITLNQSKCEAFLSDIEEAQSENNSLPSDLESALADKTAYCENLLSGAESELKKLENYSDIPFYIIFEENLLENVNAYINSFNYFVPDFVSLASLDIEFGIKGETNEPVTMIGQHVFENKNLTNITIPTSVIIIDDDAFNNNTITNLTIPSGVTTIGDQAFYNNQLTSIIIPSSVTTIGNYVFDNNSNLISLTIDGPSRTQNLSIGDYYPFGRNITNVTINTNPSYLNLTNSTFSWNSNNACYMQIDGDLSTSSCITINNN